MQTFQNNNLEITRITKGKLPSLPFVLMKEKILGKRYSLSIAFVSPGEMKKLSKEQKGNYSHTNILSFPLEKYSGEIIISLKKARLEAKEFNHSYNEHLTFLLIHGMLHLKGHIHGHAMEKLENGLFRKYKNLVVHT